MQHPQIVSVGFSQTPNLTPDASREAYHILDLLYTYCLKPEFKNERQVARELYALASGTVNDDDVLYEQRLLSFQDFFLFDYLLSEGFSGSTAFETFLYNYQSCASLEQIHHVEWLRTAKHSLFEITHPPETPKHNLKVRDIFSNTEHEVHRLPDYLFTGFENKGQIFEGRLFAFLGKWFFTKAFILHSKQVSKEIQSHIAAFIKKRDFCKAKKHVAWQTELADRRRFMLHMTEKKEQIQNTSHRKAIDLLTVTKQLAQLPRRPVRSPHLVMSLGIAHYVSPYVPETPFYDVLQLIHELAYCLVKSYRYKHIDPVKIYQLPKGS